MKIKNYDNFIFENIEPSKNLNEEYKVIAEKLEHFWQTLKIKLAEMEKINARDEDDVMIYNNNIKKGGSNPTNPVTKKQPITPRIGSENKPEYKQNPEHQQVKPNPSKKVFVDEIAKEGRKRKAKELSNPIVSKNVDDKNPEHQQVSPNPTKKVFVDEKAKEGRLRKASELSSQILKTAPKKDDDDETENVEKMQKKPINPKDLVQAK